MDIKQASFCSRVFESRSPYKVWINKKDGKTYTREEIEADDFDNKYTFPITIFIEYV